MVMQEFGKLGIAAVVLVIAVAIGFIVVANVITQIGTQDGLSVDPEDGVINSTECEKSLSCNGTFVMREAIATIPGWVPLVILVAIGGLLLVMVKGFGGKR